MRLPPTGLMVAWIWEEVDELRIIILMIYRIMGLRVKKDVSYHISVGQLAS